MSNPHLQMLLQLVTAQHSSRILKVDNAIPGTRMRQTAGNGSETLARNVNQTGQSQTSIQRYGDRQLQLNPLSDVSASDICCLFITVRSSDTRPL